MDEKQRNATFEDIVREHHAAAWRSAWRILRNAEDAGDVVQQVFLDVLQKPETFAEARDPRRVLCWLAIRKSLSHLRAAESRRRREEEHAMQPDAGQNPEYARDERAGIVRLLAELPEKLRLPLVLRFEEDLTYKAIAEALQVSEPTAHERVKTGLASMRQALPRLGLAGLAPRLEEVLGQPAPVPVPGGLETRLLSLATTTTAGATGLSAVAVWSLTLILVVGAGSVVAARLLGDEPEAVVPGAPVAAASAGTTAEHSEPGRVTTSPLPRGGAQPAQPPEVSEAAAPASATSLDGVIEGLVRDDRALSLEGALVVAAANEWGQKGSSDSWRAKTDVGGRFTIRVPLGEKGRRRFMLRATLDGYAAATTDVFEVRRQAAPALQDLELAPVATTPPGQYTLDLQLLWGNERPVARARVALNRRWQDPRGRWREDQDAAGVTDADGRVSLSGRCLGAKSLAVMIFDRTGFSQRQHRLTVEHPGRTEATVRLDQGLSIEGRLTTVDGSTLKDFPLAARLAASNTWIDGTLEADGRFRIEGLMAERYEIFVGNERWSPLDLDPVPAGTRDLAIVLKPRIDPRDHGSHAAEIHGRFVDAATGKRLAIGPWNVDAHRIRDPGNTDLEGDFLPSLLPPFMGQIAIGPDTPRAGDLHAVGMKAGTWVLKVAAPGYAPSFAGPFTLRRHELRTDVTVRVAKGYTVSGRVTEPDGQPLAGAWVYATGTGPLSRRTLAQRDAFLPKLKEGDRRDPFGACARTDAQGRFTLKRLPQGLVLRLAVLHKAFAPAFGPVLAGGAADDLELVAGTRR